MSDPEEGAGPGSTTWSDPWLDPMMDLVLGSRCVLCEGPGQAVCGSCRGAVRGRPQVVWPRPTPPGLAIPVAIGEYAGALQSLIVAHKERGRLALARPLGRALATAVLDCATRTGCDRPLVLVPVPSHPATARGRGQDPMLRTARVASAALRAQGVDAQVARAIAVSARPRDQAGLGAADRAANVAMTMTRTRAAVPPGGVIVVDDVITTGSTLGEAQRALEVAGVRVAGHAVIAATRRRAATAYL